jgi:hypothetical protein
MTEFEKTPFNDDGMTEATSRRVTAETFDDAWRRVVAETPYRSETDRALALSAKDQIKPPGADRPGFHIAEKLRVVAIQGVWWYRGVTRVEPHPGGSLVTDTVVNVAQGWVLVSKLPGFSRNSDEAGGSTARGERENP